MAKKSATKASGKTANWDAIEIGDQVRHPKWGVGTVLFRSGSGQNAKAIVVFPEEGQKKLMLRYAKLQKVGSTSLKSVEKMKSGKPSTKPAAKNTPAPATAEQQPAEPQPESDKDSDFLDEETEVVGFDDDDDDFLQAEDEKGD